LFSPDVRRVTPHVGHRGEREMIRRSRAFVNVPRSRRCACAEIRELCDELDKTLSRVVEQLDKLQRRRTKLPFLKQVTGNSR
jgi:hypothetical protein